MAEVSGHSRGDAVTDNDHGSSGSDVARGDILERFLDDIQERPGCARCRSGEHFSAPIRMAFQPIVDVAKGEVFAHEALVRGPNGESAGAVIAAVTPEQRYSFDQTCRVAAIQTAVRVGMATRLSINFMANSVYDPATCIRITLAAAERYGFDTEKLIFEMTEGEQIRDPVHALAIVRDYQKRGFMTAIDDFGAGFSGLNLLAQFQPHIVKLDMALTRDIDSDRIRRAIVEGVVGTCRALECQVVAEGVETMAEAQALRGMGITLFQGYLFARPEVEALPEPDPAAMAALAGR